MTAPDLRNAAKDASNNALPLGEGKINANTNTTKGAAAGDTIPDVIDGTTDGATEANNRPIGDGSFPGELLRNAREKAGLSIGDVATKLRMAVRQIEALEKADYANLPSGTFLRGFVRNYAKFVHIEPERAIALLEQTHKASVVVKPATIVTPNHDIKINITPRDLSSAKNNVLTALAVLVLLGCAAAYWWFNVRPHMAEGGRPKAADTPTATTNGTSSGAPAISTSTSATPMDPTQPVSANTVPLPMPLPDGAGPPSATSAPTAASVAQPATASAPAGSVTPSTLAPASPASVPQVAVVTPVPANGIAALPGEPTTPPKKGRGVLGFTFAGESWVEVIDASGRTILSKRYSAGDTDEVTGRPPFNVTVGKAGVTRMAFNGREVDLAPHTKVAVARVVVK